MRRLVYLYVSNGAADPSMIPSWDITKPSEEPFCRHFISEGFCYLFKEFIRRELFDEILVVIESNRSPGCFWIAPKIQGIVVPHINALQPLLREHKDILWARGGWRSWFPFLENWHNNDNWLLFYRAASNRGAWKFWDIVFDDLIEETSQDDIGRFYYPINKPINPGLFCPVSMHKHYDLMIGASHIHDKKGQYKILPVLRQYRKQFGRNLNCIMPGNMKNGTGTAFIDATIKKHQLSVFLPGMVERYQLRHYYDMSKLFIHCGASGQNDRGPLEAMACGTPVMLSHEEFHAPCIRWENCQTNFHIDIDEPEIAAGQIYNALKMINAQWHLNTSQYFNMENGIEKIYRQFEKIFELIFLIPHQDRQDIFDSFLTGGK